MSNNLYSKRIKKRFQKERELYLLILPGMLLLLVFRYIPIYGIIVSFQDYIPAFGVLGSKWVGFKHFMRFFNDPFFFRLMRNTFLLGFYTIVFGFPVPIILALMFNELKNKSFKRISQTISYMPHFLSTVIVVGLVFQLFEYNTGNINYLLEFIGIQRINFIGSSEWFRFLYIISGIWQTMGFSSIIYIAAISGINPELYESAIIDGAGRFRQIVNITLPSIAPTIIILLIFSVGGVLATDFQKIILMYSPAIYETADVIQTYIFRAGILGASFSYATAAGFFISVISFFFVLLTNRLAKTVGETSLW